jgi:hypothetical protein
VDTANPAARCRNPEEATMPPTVEEVQAELATERAQLTSVREEMSGAQARIKAQNEENKGHRLNADNAKRDLTNLQTEVVQLREQHAAALTAADKKAADATGALETLRTEHQTALNGLKESADTRVLTAELRAQAAKAGMLDVDGIKLLDTSTVKLDDKGNLVLPDQFFETAKTARPWMFGAPPPAANSTSNPLNPPAPNPNANVKFGDMADADQKAFEAKHGIKV